jgi:hypothetical protein
MWLLVPWWHVLLPWEVFHEILLRELVTFPFFASMTSSVVLKKGLPNIIVLEVFLPMSMIKIST